VQKHGVGVVVVMEIEVVELVLETRFCHFGFLYKVWGNLPEAEGEVRVENTGVVVAGNISLAEQQMMEGKIYWSVKCCLSLLVGVCICKNKHLRFL